MEKIKHFLKKYKYNTLTPLLQTVIITLCIIIFALLCGIIMHSNQKQQQIKYSQRLQQCMYLFPQNTVEQCEFLSNK